MWCRGRKCGPTATQRLTFNPSPNPLDSNKHWDNQLCASDVSNYLHVFAQTNAQKKNFHCNIHLFSVISCIQVTALLDPIRAVLQWKRCGYAIDMPLPLTSCQVITGPVQHLLILDKPTGTLQYKLGTTFNAIHTWKSGQNVHTR